MIVELRNVEKWYDEGSTRRKVLYGVDMHIQAGERVALAKVARAKVHYLT